MITRKILLLLLVTSLYAEGSTLSGHIISDNKKMITSRFMGFITKVFITEGDNVKKGQLLYSIDSKEVDSSVTQVQLAISQAQLSLQMYQNQHENVLLNLNRHQRLLERDMVSKFEVENLELSEKNLASMINIAKQQVSQAQTQLVEAKNQYQYLNVRAPNNGVIVKKNIKVGEMAMPGMPALILSDLSDLKVIADISETDLVLIQLGTQVKVEVASLKLHTSGKVIAIIPNSNPVTHTFQIKISFDTQGKSVYPGMYATVSLNN